jgi:hypothetical protein
MKGAIVFLVFFVIFGAVTLWYYTDLPPGRQLYGLLNVPETSYPVLGIPASILIFAVFNGIIYGVIAWLILTIIVLARRKKVVQKVAPPTSTTEPKKFCISCGAEISSKVKYCPKCGAAQ